MAEQIRVFELKIDVDAAIKSTSQLKTTTDNLKKTLNEFKEAGDTSSEAYVRTAAAVKNSSKEYNAAQTQIGKLLALQGKEIKTVEQGRNALTILNKEWAKTRSLYGETSKASLKLADQHKMLKDRVNELQKGVGDTSANIGNYSEGFKEAAAQSTLFGRAQRTVNTILLVAAPVIDLVRKQLQGIKANYIAATTGTKGYSTAQKAAAIGTNLVSAALKLFRIALISTGIGAIVILLGSLVAYFTSTQQGIDAVNKVLIPLRTIFQSLLGVLEKLGGVLVDTFSNPKQAVIELWNVIKTNLVNRITAIGGIFKALGKIISSGFKDGFKDLANATIQASTGVEDVIGKVGNAAKNLSEFTNEAIKNGKVLADLQIQIEKSENAQIENKAKLLNQIKEQELIAKNTSKSATERNNAAQLARQLSFELLKSETDILDLKIKELQIQQSLNDTSREEDAELQKLLADRIAKETEQRSIELKFLSVKKAFQTEQIANAKKLTDEAIKESQIKLKLFIEQNKGEAESLEQGLKLQEEIRDKKLAILQDQIDAGNKTQLEGELEALKIKNDFLEQQAQLTVDFTDKELEAFRLVNQTRIDEGQLLTDELVAQEKSRLEAIAEAERQALATRLENGVISQQEYNEAIAGVDAEAKEAKDEIELEQKEQKDAADVIDLENKRALQGQSLDYDLEFQLNELNTKKQAELDAAEQTGADKALIEDKYADLEKKTTAAVNANKLQLASQTFGSLAGILGKESKAGKATAIAQTTIDTYQGATAAYKSLAGIPVVGPVLGGIAAAAAVAGGIANVRKIASTQAPKAAKGMTLQGNRHAAGGIDLFDGSGSPVVNAEDGENIYVINRNASALINGLSNVNQLTGGVPLSTPVNFAADGGLVQRSIQAQTGASVSKASAGINYKLLSQMIGASVGQANMLLPPPVTDVKDIIGQVGSFNDVVDGANL